eukprot:GHVU01219347.1.p2 GENE.GHVU01219347.1~~GHVU01219347.1.p2  ORF type:complete len:199 (-),score=19.24 GHVU01219347.1:1309-1905(-)
MDAYCRAVAVSIPANPASCNDAMAYQRWDVKNKIDAFPPGYFAIGDAAYPLGLHVMTPFRVPQLDIVEGDERAARVDYNHAISQLRIRAEMTFGFMLNKFRIFHRPLAMKVSKVLKIINAAFRIHNFIITRAIREKGRRPGRRWVESNSNCTDYTRLAESGDESSDAPDLRLTDCSDGHELRETLVRVVDAAKITWPR